MHPLLLMLIVLSVGLLVVCPTELVMGAIIVSYICIAPVWWMVQRGRIQREQVSNDRDIRARQLLAILAMLGGRYGGVSIWEEIPDEQYTPPENDVEPLPTVDAVVDDENPISDCGICLEQMDSGQPVVKLSCGHIYHGDCINRWRRTSDTCPVCREPATTSVTNN